ncbi:hypothetical protein M8C21_018140, partial [Ambrosia artemisiifolia]
EYTRNDIPAFGSWDCNDNLAFTQCFESAREAGLLRYSYSGNGDLYVAGDLYDNINVVTPAMIVVPRRRGKAGYPRVKEGKKDAWVMCDYEYDYNYTGDVKEPQSPVSVATPRPQEPSRSHVKPKAVDEDLYRISPDLREKPRRDNALQGVTIVESTN